MELGIDKSAMRMTKSTREVVAQKSILFHVSLLDNF